MRSVQLSELDRIHEFNGRLGGVDDLGLTRGHILPLDVHSLSGGLRVSLGLIIGAHAGLERLAARRHSHVLDAYVDALRNDATANLFVADDTNSVLGHIEDFASLAMVELVGHATLDGSVGQDVDVVTLAVGDEVLAQRGNSVLSERS